MIASGNESWSRSLEELRRKAEAIAKAHGEVAKTREYSDIQSLLHELDVSQTELEIQNEELREAQLAIESSRNRYFELFDVAPVAYLEVSLSGIVMHSNAAAGRLLGIDRAQARAQPLLRFLARESHGTVLAKRRRALAVKEAQTCETVIVRPDGRTFHALLETVLLPSRDPPMLLCALVDISEQKRTEAVLANLADELQVVNRRLQELAMHDPLTGLLNRRGFAQVLTLEMERAKRSSAPACGILIDCDDFKSINDGLGHAAGDVVLATLARRLQGALRPSDSIARVGGDEFLVLLPDTRVGEGAQVAEGVRLAAAADPIPLSEGSVALTLSLAVAPIDAFASTIEEVLSGTRLGLKESKGRGKNRTSVAPCAGLGGPHAAPEITSFRELLSRGDFFRVVAQPIIAVPTGRVVGYELLTRGPSGALHLPAGFFRVAAEENLLTTVDMRCLRLCIDASSALPAEVRRHVNLYPSTLVETDTDRIASLFPSTLGGGPFCVELSEQQMVGDPSSMRDHVAALRASGILLAIDDLGFGRTSLETLIVLEPDMVKIDRGYVAGIAADTSKARSLRRLVNVAHSLRATLVAEGIESSEDLAVVQDMGIEYAQGFLWGEACSPTEYLRSDSATAGVG